MGHEYSADPWKHRGDYQDRAYPSGVAQERPALVTRIHCEPEEGATQTEANLHGPAKRKADARAAELAAYRESHEVDEKSFTDQFNAALRAGHGFRNSGEE